MYTYKQAYTHTYRRIRPMFNHVRVRL